MLLAGQKVYVGPFLKKSDRPVDRESQFTNVYVKNLPESVNDEKLNEMFSEHGSVTSAVVMKVSTTCLMAHSQLSQSGCCATPHSQSIARRQAWPTLPDHMGTSLHAHFGQHSFSSAHLLFTSVAFSLYCDCFM